MTVSNIYQLYMYKDEFINMELAKWLHEIEYAPT